jgi:hypothetical protein
VLEASTPARRAGPHYSFGLRPTRPLRAGCASTRKRKIKARRQAGGVAVHSPHQHIQ